MWGRSGPARNPLGAPGLGGRSGPSSRCAVFTWHLRPGRHPGTGPSLVDTWQRYAPGSSRLPGRAGAGAEILARHRAGPERVFVQAQRPGASEFPGDPSAAAGVCRPSQSRRRGRTDSDQERRPRRGPCPARAWRSKPSAQASSDALRPGPSDSVFPSSPGSADWRLVLCFQASAWALSCIRPTPISTR